MPDDLKALAVPALAHRVMLRSAPGAEVDGDAIIGAIADATPVPR